ncbi:DUF1989 domain-containing protein [Pseudoalteromonas sp. Hal099]
MARVFCAITDDTLGWHDTLSGNSNAQSVEKNGASATTKTNVITSSKMA